MPESGYHHRGINDIGHVDGGSDVSWGKTQQAGAVLQLATTTADLQSGQSKVMEESEVITADMQLVFNLLSTALQQMQYYLGIPDADFSGDLTGGPTQEVLDIDESIGSIERQIFAEGPGPSSTRRIDVARAKLADFSDLGLAHDGYATPQVTWRALAPSSGAPVTITDAV